MKLILSTVAGSCVVLGALTADALAAEGSIFGGPVGGTDIRNAYLPSDPGFYGSLVGAFASSTSIKGDNGVTSNATERSTVAAAAGGLSYVYPFKILGATAASFGQLNYQKGDFALGGKVQAIGAMGDPYVEFLGLSWNLGRVFGGNGNTEEKKLPYGLTLKASYSMLFPVGYYSSSALTTPGHNDFFFIPNFAATYLFGPNALGDGLEVSAHAFFDIAAKNPTTNYKTGTVADLDFAVSERTGVWQYGLAGYYARQIENDYVNGSLVLPTGKRLEAFDLGPVLAYDIPSLKATFKLKIYVPVFEQNTLNSVRGFVSVGFKL